MHKAQKSGRLRLPVIYLILLMVVTPLLFQVTQAAAEPYPAGWKQQWRVPIGSSFKHASPTLADLEGDGKLETLVGNLNGWLYCFDSGGNQRWAYNTGAQVQSTPLAVDTNKDGKLEIFFGSDNGWVYGLNYAGGVLAGWPQNTASTGGFSGVFSSPAAGDLDGNGDLEIVAGSWGHYVYAWHHDGSIVAGWPFDNYDTVWSSPACVDVDLDGCAEVIVGGDVTGAAWWYAPGGLLWVLEGNGSPRMGWPKWIRQVIWSSPAMADLNGDGFVEIVVGTGQFYGEDVAMGEGNFVYAWDYMGNTVPGWPAATSGNVFASPAIADVNNDGSMEVACTCNDGWLRVWRSNGTPLWANRQADSQKLGSPSIGDINADGKPDVIIGDYGWITGFDGPSGNLILSQYQDDGSIWSTPALGDIDADKKIEVVVGTGVGEAGKGALYCFEAGTYNAAKCTWPMFRKDAAHTASYPHVETPDKWAPADVKSQWYLAEGYTGPGFDEYILLMNPLNVAVEVQLRYLLTSGQSVVRFITIPPNSRQTVLVNSVVLGSDVSVAAISNQDDVVIERAMYFDYQGNTGGTCVVGIDQPSKEWYLAEGYTGGSFDTYVLMANPDQVNTAHVQVTFMTETGPMAPKSYSIKPKARLTIHVDEIPGLDNANVSTKIVSDIPIACERAMYFKYVGGMGLVDGGHGAKAVAAPNTDWYMAEGCTSPAFDTYLLVQNPGTATAHCTATFMKTGAAPQDFKFSVGAGRRFSQCIDNIPGMDGAEFSIHVLSDVDVIAERAMYFNLNGRTGGHDVAGVNGSKLNWYLAEGYTGGSFDTFILVQNPNRVAVNVTFNFLGVYQMTRQIGPTSRLTIWVDTIPGMADLSFATKITGTQPIIVERAMYFDYSGKTGGHCTLGYAP